MEVVYEGAHAYTKPGTIDEFYLANNQYTVPFNDNGSTDTYDGKLSAAGIAKICEIEKAISECKYRDTIRDYTIKLRPSGMWFPDKSSKYYTDQSVALNTFMNRAIVGLNSDNRYITTSLVVFFTSKWCYTIKGSIYKLENMA